MVFSLILNQKLLISKQGPVVQRIECKIADLAIEVRLLSRAPDSLGKWVHSHQSTTKNIHENPGRYAYRPRYFCHRLLDIFPLPRLLRTDLTGNGRHASDSIDHKLIPARDHDKNKFHSDDSIDFPWPDQPTHDTRPDQ